MEFERSHPVLTTVSSRAKYASPMVESLMNPVQHETIPSHDRNESVAIECTGVYEFDRDVDRIESKCIIKSWIDDDWLHGRVKGTYQHRPERYSTQLSRSLP